RTYTAFVKGKQETHGPDDVGSHLPQYLALHQCFPDEPELIMFKVAKSTVDQFGGAGGGARGEVVHFGECDLIAATSRITRNAASVNSTANYEDVKFRLDHIAPAFHILFVNNNIETNSSSYEIYSNVKRNAFQASGLVSIRLTLLSLQIRRRDGIGQRSVMNV